MWKPILWWRFRGRKLPDWKVREAYSLAYGDKAEKVFQPWFEGQMDMRHVRLIHGDKNEKKQY